MIIKNINLETVCGITSKLPENDKPEIAFAGKSNVGKSSLINALMKPEVLRPDLGHAGKDPDHQFLQYQRCAVSGGPAGYGYAKVSQQEKENGER
mgnify:CR=1 FL=1